MNKDNNLGRVLALLSLTLLMSFGLYSLPDTLFGYKIKKVDLLSDFKVKEEKLSLDSLKQQLEQADTLQVDSVALRDSIMRSAGIDSAALALRDSLYKAVYAVQGADSLGAHIEDYSLGHIGLQRFFAALKNRRELNRPVRVDEAHQKQNSAVRTAARQKPVTKNLNNFERRSYDMESLEEQLLKSN